MGIHSVLDRPTAPSSPKHHRRAVLGADSVPAIGLASRAEWRARDHVTLHDLWSTELDEALVVEARTARSHAARPGQGEVRRISAHRPGDAPTLVATGPVLTQLHGDLAGLARRLTGQVLVPTLATYHFYDEDDEVRLHLDEADCDLTMVVSVLGSPGPLHLHPELVGRTAGELAALEADPTWDRWSGVAVDRPRRGVTAYRGRKLPHHRPGCLLGGLAAVAILPFRSVPEWVAPTVRGDA